MKRLALLSTCLICTAANAADNGFYFGGGVGKSDFNVGNALKNTDTAYKIIAGARLLDSFGVEASYADLGKASLPSGIACIALVGTNCPATTNASAKATSAFAVGFLDFPLLQVKALLLKRRNFIDAQHTFCLIINPDGFLGFAIVLI